MAQVILTTTGTNSWTVPSDWNNVGNTIEVLGAGGAGGSAALNFGGGGGGGGGYSKTTNLTFTPGASVSYTIGTAGAAGAAGANGTAGGDTYFNGASLGASSVGAKGGGAGVGETNGHGTSAGGDSASGVGSTKYSGGGGGSTSGFGGAGGGGSAGPTGSGGAGTNNGGGTTVSGGTGDNGVTAAGANGTQWTTVGSGGGGAGSGAGAGTTGGNYGAGGGGGHTSNGVGGVGTQGLIVITYTPQPSDLYWIGGTGNWDTVTTSHWSASSGGGTVSAVPNSVTNVHFDGNSGVGTATIADTSLAANLDFTGYTGTLTGSALLSIYGNLTIVSGMTYTYTGIITFSATASGKTITTAGKTMGSLTFDGVGGGWTLQDNVTTSGAGLFTLTNGSLNFGNKNVSTSRFVSSNSNTRVLTMGSGTITLTTSGTVWSCATSTGFTVTPNTSTIKITDATSSSKTFAGSGLTYNNIWLTGAGTGTFIITGSNTFNDFKCDTPPHTINFTAGTRTTFTTFTVNGTAGNLITLQSTSSGSTWYLYRTTLTSTVCDYLSIQDCHASSI